MASGRFIIHKNIFLIFDTQLFQDWKKPGTSTTDDMEYESNLYETKGELNILRSQDNVPGVIYGGEDKNQNISVSNGYHRTIRMYHASLDENIFLGNRMGYGF